MNVLSSKVVATLNETLYALTYTEDGRQWKPFAPAGRVVDSMADTFLVARSVSSPQSEVPRLEQKTLYARHKWRPEFVVIAHDVDQFICYYDGRDPIMVKGTTIVPSYSEIASSFVYSDEIRLPHGTPLTIKKARNVLLARFEQGTYIISHEAVSGPDTPYPFITWMPFALEPEDILPIGEVSLFYYRHNDMAYSSENSKPLGPVDSVYPLSVNGTDELTHIIRGGAVLVHFSTSITLAPEHIDHVVEVAKWGEVYLVRLDTPSELTQGNGYWYHSGPVVVTYTCVYLMHRGSLHCWKLGHDPVAVTVNDSPVTAVDIHVPDNVAVIDGRYYSLDRDMAEIPLPMI